ncbi:hypothetical protein LINPERHAP1_LOCUS34179 [Linum perenne]
MSGCRSPVPGTRNGGTLPFTMSLLWLELVFSLFPLPCLTLDGKLLIIKLFSTLHSDSKTKDSNFGKTGDQEQQF